MSSGKLFKHQNKNMTLAIPRRLSNVLTHNWIYFIMQDNTLRILYAKLVFEEETKLNRNEFSLPGHFPLPSVYCLAWICLDVLFCTASIMHLCTISVDRYLSLRYPMKFGRNKSRRRVTLKIVFVWLLSIAMSLPLSLMYSKVSTLMRSDQYLIITLI